MFNVYVKIEGPKMGPFWEQVGYELDKEDAVEFIKELQLEHGQNAVRKEKV